MSKHYPKEKVKEGIYTKVIKQKMKYDEMHIILTFKSEIILM